MTEKLLELIGVGKDYTLRGGFLAKFTGRVETVQALRDVTLEVRKSEIFGLVGESGSGKSTLGRVIVSLIQPSSGALVFRNREVKDLRPRELAAFRRRTQMVFQDTGSSLNPRKRIGTALTEALAARGAPRAGRRATAEDLLRCCGLAAFVLRRFPHELSGGQRQRVGIARALAMEPDLLVADEPVSALDVSLQGQVINLLVRLNADLGLTMVFISHDLAVVRHICTRVAVMFAGRIVEMGDPATLMARPAHPYTEVLIEAVPRGLAGRARPRAAAGEATLPTTGCRFRPRCRAAMPVCAEIDPPIRPLAPGHDVACHAAPEIAAAHAPAPIKTPVHSEGA